MSPAQAFLADKLDLVTRMRALGAHTKSPFVLLLVDRRGAALFSELFNDAHRIEASCAVVPIAQVLSCLPDKPAADSIRRQLQTHVGGPVAPTLVAACNDFYFDHGGARGQA